MSDMKTTERLAPELRVKRWIGKDGEVLDSQLKLSDLGTGAGAGSFRQRTVRCTIRRGTDTTSRPKNFYMGNGLRIRARFD